WDQLRCSGRIRRGRTAALGWMDRDARSVARGARTSNWDDDLVQFRKYPRGLTPPRAVVVALKEISMMHSLSCHRRPDRHLATPPGRPTGRSPRPPTAARPHAYRALP